MHALRAIRRCRAALSHMPLINYNGVTRLGSMPRGCRRLDVANGVPREPNQGHRGRLLTRVGNESSAELLLNQVEESAELSNKHMRPITSPCSARSARDTRPSHATHIPWGSTTFDHSLEPATASTACPGRRERRPLAKWVRAMVVKRKSQRELQRRRSAPVLRQVRPPPVPHHCGC